MAVLRANTETIQNAIEANLITALIGPRRVGKSFFLNWYMAQYPDRNWISINLDQLETKRHVEAGKLEQLIIEAAQTPIGHGTKLWVIIDEAQKSPLVFDQVKSLYDQYINDDAIKFILTGSAVLGLHQLSAESLAGRIDLHIMNGFTLREASQFQAPTLPQSSTLELIAQNDFDALQSQIDLLKPFKSILTAALNDQLVWGNLPEVIRAASAHNKMIYLRNYLQTYLEKDVRALQTITDLELYRNLLQVCAEQTGSMRHIQRMSQALGSKADTVKKYQGYLEATLLFTQLYPYITSSLGRLAKSPKAYILNNGLISMLTGLTDLDQLQSIQQLGHRFENWFLGECQTWRARSPMPSTIHYLRTSGGAEIDFIVRSGQLLLPIETTTASTITHKKTQTLRRFLSTEPAAKWGLIIYQGPFKIDEHHRLIYLPAWTVS